MDRYSHIKKGMKKISKSTFRSTGYSVVVNGIKTDKVVFSYDPEEYKEHRLVNAEPGKPDRTISSRWFRCDVCKGKYPIEEYNDAWDWAGPHCPNPNCGNGGMVLFGKRHGPVLNIKSVVAHRMEEYLKNYKINK
jgi:hypothetical protein